VISSIADLAAFLIEVKVMIIVMSYGLWVLLSAVTITSLIIIYSKYFRKTTELPQHNQPSFDSQEIYDIFVDTLEGDKEWADRVTGGKYSYKPIVYYPEEYWKTLTASEVFSLQDREVEQPFAGTFGNLTLHTHY
jgi:hypothetical protein